MYRILYVPTGEFLPIAEFSDSSGKHYFEYTHESVLGINSKEFAEAIIEQILEVWERVTTEDHPDFMPNEDGSFLIGYCGPILNHFGTIKEGDSLTRESFEIVDY